MLYSLVSICRALGDPENKAFRVRNNIGLIELYLCCKRSSLQAASGCHLSLHVGKPLNCLVYASGCLMHFDMVGYVYSHC